MHRKIQHKLRSLHHDLLQSAGVICSNPVRNWCGLDIALARRRADGVRAVCQATNIVAQNGHFVHSVILSVSVSKHLGIICNLRAHERCRPHALGVEHGPLGAGPDILGKVLVTLERDGCGAQSGLTVEVGVPGAGRGVQALAGLVGLVEELLGRAVRADEGDKVGLAEALGGKLFDQGRRIRAGRRELAFF